MIRFIIRRTLGFPGCGEVCSYQSLDLEVDQLEEILCRGGYGSQGYENFDVHCVEILHPEKTDSQLVSKGEE